MFASFQLSTAESTSTVNPTHTERNRQTRPNWEHFQSHRVHVTQLLIDVVRKHPANEATHDKPRICILGAGNCNDLDLNRLATAFAHVCLMDIDRDAMDYGVTSQHVADKIEIMCCDVMGDELPDVRFDVVASTCLLTQLFVDIDPSSATADDYVNIRRQHFLTILRLMKPSGSAVFITDVVSSDTVPNLTEHDPEQLAQRLPQWIQQRNFFTGTNPAVVHQLLTADEEISPQLNHVTPIAPWLWNPGPRTYVCYGMSFSH